MTQNKRRVNRIHKAIAWYRKDCEPQEALIDALTDLQHWADANQVDFNDALRVARMHHTHERIKERA